MREMISEPASFQPIASVITIATPMVSMVPIKTEKSERIINVPFCATSPNDIAMIGLIRGATIIAPMITAALLASRPSVAITADIASIKKNEKEGIDPFSTVTSISSTDADFSTS